MDEIITQTFILDHCERNTPYDSKSWRIFERFKSILEVLEVAAIGISRKERYRNKTKKLQIGIEGNITKSTDEMIYGN